MGPNLSSLTASPPIPNKQGLGTSFLSHKEYCTYSTLNPWRNPWNHASLFMRPWTTTSGNHWSQRDLGRIKLTLLKVMENRDQQSGSIWGECIHLLRNKEWQYLKGEKSVGDRWNLNASHSHLPNPKCTLYPTIHGCEWRKLSVRSLGGSDPWLSPLWNRWVHWPTPLSSGSPYDWQNVFILKLSEHRSCLCLVQVRS